MHTVQAKLMVAGAGDTFTFGDWGDRELHRRGDEACAEGLCKGKGAGEYPLPCKCGGLIHANFGDESSDGDYWLYEKCDRCGKRNKFDW